MELRIISIPATMIASLVIEPCLQVLADVRESSISAVVVLNGWKSMMFERRLGGDRLNRSPWRIHANLQSWHFLAPDYSQGT
jgi:hypothetical protein